ncbi:MAG: OB-fold nucleic acid binding domain-containing protein, partial [Gammaproteobacteria bacterium]
VKGLRETAAAAIVAARGQRRFASVADLASRSRLRRDALELLGRADALAGLAGNRHRAAWAVAGVEPAAGLVPPADDGPALPLLRAPHEGEDIVADYARTGFSLRRHPLALLRGQLDRLRASTAVDIAAYAHGSTVTVAGLVINRQRPGSAKGVTFMTLEDETGYVNLIVWPQVAERYNAAVTGARLLSVRGTLQREGEVIHVVARRLDDHSALVGALTVKSRDFH